MLLIIANLNHVYSLVTVLDQFWLQNKILKQIIIKKKIIKFYQPTDLVTERLRGKQTFFFGGGGGGGNCILG